MLELPNFDHMTKFTIKFESYNEILLLTSWTEIITSQPLFKNTFISRKPRVAIFTDIIEIVTMFIKTVFKYSKKC